MWIQQKQLFGDGWVNILFLTLYLEIETSTQITTPFLNRINENHSIFEDTTEVGSGIVTKQSTIIQVYHDATPMMSQKAITPRLREEQHKSSNIEFQTFGDRKYKLDTCIN